NQNAAGTTVTFNNLTVNGTYTVVVRDFNSTHAGGYAVTAVMTGPGIVQNAGGDGGPIASAVTKAANIGVGDIDVFTLNGVAGGTLLASIGETTAGSSLTPQIALYGPNGKLLTSNQNAAGTTLTVNNLTANGTYTVLVRDFTGTGTGNYAVTPVSIGPGITQNSGGDAGPIASALTKTATIGIGDIDAFTLNGVAGGA